MPRFMRRRVRWRPAAEPPTAEPDLVERAILEEERRLTAEELRISRRWGRRMGPLYVLGLAATLLMLITAGANAPAGVIVTGLISVALNALSSYATHKGGMIAPDKFPVRYLSETGWVNGTIFSACVSGFCVIVVLFAVRHVWS